MPLILLALLLSTLLPKSVLAAPTRTSVQPFISVYPVIFNIPLSPGKKTVHTITVANLLDDPLPLHASLESFNLSDEDLGTTPPNGFGRWATVIEPDMILNPKEIKKVHVAIELPKKIPIGGYYASLNLEPRLLSGSSTTYTRIQPQIGILFLGSVGVPKIASTIGSIRDFDLPLLSEGGSIPTHFVVKNVSLYHFSAKPRLVVRSVFGRGKELEIEEKITLPGRARSWDIPIEFVGSSYGVYQIELRVSVGQGHQIRESRYLILMPYKKLVVGIGSLLLGLFLIRKRHRLRDVLAALMAK